MVRARCRRGAQPFQRHRGPPVVGKTPARSDRVVDRAAHDGVAEAKEPRRRLGADAVVGDELVEELERAGGCESRGLGGELGLEGLAGHRGTLEHPPRVRGEVAQLLFDRRDDRRRDLDRGFGAGRRCLARRRHGRSSSQELLDVKRVAPALEEDSPPRRLGPAGEKRGGLRLGQRAQHHVLGARVARCRLERS